MAKRSSINKNQHRQQMVERDRAKRAALRSIIKSKETTVKDRFNASIKLAELPRNGSRTRVRLRCEMTGRSRSNYRKFRLSRIAIRELGNAGQIPGLTKSSW